MCFLIYIIPGLIWFLFRRIYNPSQEPFTEYPFAVFVFIFLYPIIFLLNYRSFLKMRKYLKPFKKWKFIFLTKVDLIKKIENEDNNLTSINVLTKNQKN